MTFILLAVLAQGAAPTSAYTPLNLERCSVVTRAQSGEGDWVNRRCPGHARVPLIVHEDDGRFDLDAGVDNAAWESLSGFNRLGPQVEWRIAGGRPFAVIYRFLPTDPAHNPDTTLAIETVGRPGRPGCLVAMILSGPGANLRARRIADARARGFRCGTDRTITDPGP